MTDNGSAMISGEFTAGLHHLGILHLPTLPYSPHVYVAAAYMFSSIGKLLDLQGDPRQRQHITDRSRLIGSNLTWRFDNVEGYFLPSRGDRSSSCRPARQGA
jgi:hypothetical protein